MRQPADARVSIRRVRGFVLVNVRATPGRTIPASVAEVLAERIILERVVTEMRPRWYRLEVSEASAVAWPIAGQVEGLARAILGCFAT